LSDSLFTELKQRNVFKVGTAYLVVSWLLIQIVDTVVPHMTLPEWIPGFVIIALMVGFPIALILAWVFEITAEGIKKESEVKRDESTTSQTGRKLDFIIIGLMAIALTYFIYESRFTTGKEELAKEQSSSTKPTELQASDLSIAVLAFADMSPNKDQEYFSDGIAEELLNLLAKLPKLRVAGRTSAFSYKNKDIKIAQIGEELNVAHVLEGSVRKAGNTLRITVQLIDARTDTHLWSETYDRPLDDIFAIQDEIAGKVVAELRLEILGEMPKVQKIDDEAYILYLQARHLANQTSKESVAKAIELYKAVLEIEPSHAPSWTWLAAEIHNYRPYDARPFEEVDQEEQDALNKALVADPNYPEVYSVLGTRAVSENDLGSAIKHYTRAMELGPKNLDVIRHISSAFLGDALGRYDEAIEGLKYVLARDQLNVKLLANLGVRYMAYQNWGEAIKYSQRVLRLSPDAGAIHFRMGYAYFEMGNVEAALAEFAQERIEFVSLAGKAVAYHALGRQAEFDNVMIEFKKHPSAKDSPTILAMVYAETGDIETAFELIFHAVKQKQTYIPEIFNASWLSNLHDDPRWNELRTKLGLEKETLEAIEFTLILPD